MAPRYCAANSQCSMLAGANATARAAFKPSWIAAQHHAARGRHDALPSAAGLRCCSSRLRLGLEGEQPLELSVDFVKQHAARRVLQ